LTTTRRFSLHPSANAQVIISGALVARPTWRDLVAMPLDGIPMRASRLVVFAVVYGVAIVAVLYFLPWLSFVWTSAILLAVCVVLMLMFF
jgi:hypothetical protein